MRLDSSDIARKGRVISFCEREPRRLLATRTGTPAGSLCCTAETYSAPTASVAGRPRPAKQHRGQAANCAEPRMSRDAVLLASSDYCLAGHARAKSTEHDARTRSRPRFSRRPTPSYKALSPRMQAQCLRRPIGGSAVLRTHLGAPRQLPERLHAALHRVQNEHCDVCVRFCIPLATTVKERL